MKNHILLLFYFVPWLALGTKMTLCLDKHDFAAAGFLVIGALVLYAAVLGFLAFQWGRRKKLWVLLLGCMIQYAANLAAGRLFLGVDLWQMEFISGMIYLICGFWQLVLFFCGRKERKS